MNPGGLEVCALAVIDKLQGRGLDPDEILEMPLETPIGTNPAIGTL
jgi:hypothetical protein